MKQRLRIYHLGSHEIKKYIPHVFFCQKRICCRLYRKDPHLKHWCRTKPKHGPNCLKVYLSPFRQRIKGIYHSRIVRYPHPKAKAFHSICFSSDASRLHRSNFQQSVLNSTYRVITRCSCLFPNYTLIFLLTVNFSQFCYETKRF